MDFNIIYTCDFGKVGFNKEEKVAYCKLASPYVPIEVFKDLLNKTKDLVIEHKLTTFLFDKSELRAFHQPSMEWYYVHWKQELLLYGLSKHRKIMPQEEWFQRCVDAGKAEIFSKHPYIIKNNILDIKYVTTAEEL